MKTPATNGARRVAAVLTAGLLLPSLIACGEHEERKLSQSERRQVSQRYADSVRYLSPLVDSACVADKPALAAALADSIYAVRLEDLRRHGKIVLQ